MIRSMGFQAIRKTFRRNGQKSDRVAAEGYGPTRENWRRRISLLPSGLIGEDGKRALFLPGKFRFCPYCKDQPPGQAREINKLAGLSAEGRSSATTLLVSSALRWMNRPV